MAPDAQNYFLTTGAVSHANKWEQRRRRSPRIGCGLLAHGRRHRGPRIPTMGYPVALAADSNSTGNSLGEPPRRNGGQQ